MEDNAENQEQILNEMLKQFEDDVKAIEEEKKIIAEKSTTIRSEDSKQNKYRKYLACHICGKIYYSRSGLSKHRLLHTKVSNLRSKPEGMKIFLDLELSIN